MVYGRQGPENSIIGTDVARESKGLCFRSQDPRLTARVRTRPPELDKTWDRFSCFVGAVPETMSIDDFDGDDDSRTTAKLTDIEIAAEVARE